VSTISNPSSRFQWFILRGTRTNLPSSRDQRAYGAVLDTIDLHREAGNSSTSKRLVKKEPVDLKDTQENLDLVYLWVLADFLQMPALQNYTIKTITEISDKIMVVPNRSYVKVYDKTAAESKL
jgi:hypothetical protein